jgi:cyclophilin family peptidyl-prolyl cis-trans isomerase
MASTGYYVGGTSQFFINLANNRAALDGKYAVFGQVVSGLSVVQVIGSAPYELQPGSTVIHEPVTPVTINTITVSTG